MTFPIAVLVVMVSILAGACSSTATPVPTPSGPSFTEEEAIAVLKQHLQTKHPLKTVPANCWMILLDKWEVSDVGLSANYDPTAHRWDLEPDDTMFLRSFLSSSANPLDPKTYLGSGDFAWSVYERTSAVVATGSDEINQLC